VIDFDHLAFFTIYGGAGGAWAWLMMAATVLGEGWTAAVLIPLLLWGRTRRFAGWLTVAVVAQTLLVWGLKRVVGRTRPWIALDLPTPFMRPSDFSFPSGHAAGCFCVAAFLTLALPAAWPDSVRRARVVTALAAAVAVLIAVSRVYLGAHFPGDVIAGAILGVAVGALAGHRYARGRSGVERAAKRG
jgi:undecaprenyl-diphosphatase